MTRVLIEASGGLTSGYIINNLRKCGATIIASDINPHNHSRLLCDEFVAMPSARSTGIREKLKDVVKANAIQLVVPSLDETLQDWAVLAEENDLNTKVSISPSKTIETFQDKWKAYEFFCNNGVSTPKTSLIAEYSLFKPRRGRGSSGIFQDEELVDIPEDYISQQFVNGVEYTIDCLFRNDGELVYCVPRKRLQIVSGKSVAGITENKKNIISEVLRISRLIKFSGMVNFQCIENEAGLFFIEVNPRLAGGMALGIAATENWFELLIKNVVLDEKITASVSPTYPLKMYRYYNEVFTE